MLLRREGQCRQPKKTQRLYREEGLTVRRRGGRKRATGLGRRIADAAAAEHALVAWTSSTISSTAGGASAS